MRELFALLLLQLFRAFEILLTKCPCSIVLGIVDMVQLELSVI